jgi:galactokinase
MKSGDFLMRTNFDLPLLKTELAKIYGNEPALVAQQFKRYENLIENFQKKYRETGGYFFSTPGRTEIGGNHTDHNHGRVLAASVNLDSIAVAAPTVTAEIVIDSDGYPAPFRVQLADLEIHPNEKGTTTALIRGIAARFQQLGLQIGGFHACVSSDVLPGSGLSSSASIEVLLGSILNFLYNRGKVAPETLALVGQYAENNYFGKPCGLMDQMACAVGGIITIDFENPPQPVVRRVDFDFAAENYNLLVVDTGGNHADLTDDYAAVPQEMRAVAAEFGKSVCRELSLRELLPRLKSLREKVGDRALLRALHFLGENDRVAFQVQALEGRDFQRFLALVRDSGNSSFKWLQNVYTVKNVREQGVSLALALSEEFLTEINAGACRVHGGGFAGTIQVFLPTEAVPAYVERMEPVFGAGSVRVLSLRPQGTVSW